ncbi:MAG: cytochrome c oxidase subunit II [Proteobacteria bacterium]|nr:cytochrome c oxidase subunit II [Pseudomonadota bacterium]
MQLNMGFPVTAAGQTAYHLHNLINIICLIIFIGVFGVMGYSMIYHRKSKGHKPAEFHENLTVEILWTAIPLLILIIIAIPATKALISLKDTSDSDITIKATGYQWKWGYDYLKGEGEGIKFMSVLATPQAQIKGQEPKDEHYLLEVDNPIVVPVGKKVRILTTSNDVIHSWAMPAFGVKQDAVPGFIRDTQFRAEKEGTYRGQCSELCGKDHGFMPIVVEVVSADKYATWVDEQKKKMAAAMGDPNKVWTLDESKAYGEKLYNANCAACHQATGKGIPGAFPALDGSKIVTGPKEGHLAVVVNGRPGTAMAAFGKQLSDTEIAAIVTYERNAWGNKTGEVVQPAEVKAAHK